MLLDGEQMTASKQLKFARDAVEVAIGLLETLPESAVREQLLGEARACFESVDGWSQNAPSAEEHEATMRAILKLHMEASRLGREAR
jgi:hypothetical protein